jgi:hypothetical protein
MLEVRLAALWALMILAIAFAARWGGVGEEASTLLAVLPALAVISMARRGSCRPPEGC